MDSEMMQAPKGERGRFIVFEGLDGSGKTTQISMLEKELKRLGRKVYCTAEPTSSITGGMIRDALSNIYQRDPAELAALFLTDRISHNINPVSGIQKFLKEGVDVICDRYYYSSFAYQGLGTKLEWVMEMNLDCPQIARPDICIFLDVDDKRCKARLDQERAHLEIFEQDGSVLEQIRARFYEILEKMKARGEQIRIVNADRPLQEVADEIREIVEGLEEEGR